MNRIVSSSHVFKKLRLQNLCQSLKRWSSSSARDVVRQLKTDDIIHGYRVKNTVEVPELMLTAVTLQHDKTGAEHLHLARDDSNNSFSVLFRTTPMDSTGVPHILEHTTLCGSRNFPVRDPFFKMLNRSLATFMNAMTASDWTIYPFTTQNKQDYQNLMSVYLDAVFYPRLENLDFCQEGWRLEHEDPENKDSPLTFNGVVYNEMKGVFSNSQNVFHQANQNNLLPSHTYGVVSGGDPTAITDLTWEQLKEFHSTHYHPSNAKFMTYGNFSVADSLEYINNHYLQKFDPIQVDTTVPSEKRWTESRSVNISCQPDPMAPDPEKQTTVTVSYLLSDVTDTFESHILSILGMLLVDGETSPFYQSLIQANIGSDYAPVLGYDGNTKEGTFSVGLQNIHPKDVEKVKEIITNTFNEVIEKGFDQKRIDAILHRIELAIKHQSSNFGLAMTLNLASFWNHDGDVLETLQINKQMEKFKQKLAEDPQFLQKKVQEYFKNNKHSLVLTMSPDESYEEKRATEEKERLKKHVEQLKPEDKQMIYVRGQELLQKQMAAEDISCLPTLKVSQIDKEIIPEPTERVYCGGVPVQCCEQPTNEVSYVRMVSNITQIPPELKAYVPLFCEVITKMGAGAMDYRQLSQAAELCTGGMMASTHVTAHHTDFLSYEQGILFSSYSLDRNLDKMLELWTEIFNRSNLKDKDRLQTLIQMTAARMSSSLSNAGHSFAMLRASSSLSPAQKLTEQFDGFSQFEVMKSIAEGDVKAGETVLAHLEEIAKLVLNKILLRVSVNASPSHMPGALKSVEKFVTGLSGQTKEQDTMTTEADFKARECSTQIELPLMVNFMSKSIQTIPYTHQDFPVMRVLARILWAKYLHREIREKGGAYGSGAVCASGTFNFFSYRDPNSLRTLEVFDDSIKWAADNGFTDQDIDEAKLSVFQQTDRPVTPGQAGQTLFTLGIDDNMRQAMRDGIFETNRQHLLDVANKYLLPGQRPSSLAFVGAANTNIEKENGWTVLKV